MRGHTLVELLLVLTLGAVGASALVPPARRLADLARVLAAREALVAALMEARAEALASGRARLLLVADPPSVRVDVAGEVGDRRRLDAETVRMRLDAGVDSIEVAFDGLGLARLASHTITVAAGEVEKRLVLSSYGRIRRP